MKHCDECGHAIHEGGCRNIYCDNYYSDTPEFCQECTEEMHETDGCQNPECSESENFEES